MLQLTCPGWSGRQGCPTSRGRSFFACLRASVSADLTHIWEPAGLLPGAGRLAVPASLLGTGVSWRAAGVWVFAAVAGGHLCVLGSGGQRGSCWRVNLPRAGGAALGTRCPSCHLPDHQALLEGLAARIRGWHSHTRLPAGSGPQRRRREQSQAHLHRPGDRPRAGPGASA